MHYLSYIHIYLTPLSRLWCGSTVQLLVTENLHHKLVLSLRSES